MSEDFDVLIVGAGLAGIGTACHLLTDCPGKRIGLLERRNRLGGTWDLFRYPGIRSDSDMYSYGYSFRPWSEPRTLADGETIQSYIADTARKFGVDEKIQYGIKVIAADWSSAEQKWNLTALHEASGETRKYCCKFFIGCTGYYDYDDAFLPSFPGEQQFKGLRIHPQRWPENLDYTGKKVVVIGSGATAVTLVPAMADKTAHITMLQRSPSYIASMPGFDHLSSILQRILPKSVVYRFARRRSIAIQRIVYLACRRWPNAMRRILLSQVRRKIGKNVDMKHFSPAYMPWDQRVCVVPDGDFFEKLKAGKASIVTEEIDTFTQTGVRLKSGAELQADIIITATGLQLQMLGGMQVSVDGKPRELGDCMTYKGVLVQDIPNFGCVFGHGNTPWTLKVELAAIYLCRLLNNMDAAGKTVAIPRDTAGCKVDESILALLSSGYVQRGSDILPRQGGAYPWHVSHHLGRDTQMLAKTPIADEWLTFDEPSGSG